MIAQGMDWLADTVLWTGLLIALVLVVRRPVARSFGPQAAYALWALPLLRLLLPPVVLPAVSAPQPLVMLPSGTGEGLAPVMLAPAMVPVPAAFPWATLLLLAWMAGALAFLLLRIGTYRRMRRLLLADAREVGRIGRVRLVETPATSSPVAFGVIDKVVALPPRFMAEADGQARELALAHELSHHQAHDLLANMAAQLLLALHWCNPVAWLGWRAMRQDQEAACDARVLAGRGRADRACYAALIVGYAAPQTRGMMTLATPMAGPVLGESALVQRLRCLTRGEASRRRRLAGRLLVGAGALALPLTATISYAAQDVAYPALPLPPEDAAVPAMPPPAATPQPIEVIDPDLPEEPIAMPADQLAPAPPAEAEADRWAAFGQRMAEYGRRMAAFAAGMEADQAAIEREAEVMAAEMERELAPGGALHGMIERQVEAQTRQADTLAQCVSAANAAGATSFACDGAIPHAMAMASQSEAFKAQASRSALAALRGARASIAGNRALSADVRAEVLRELDGEIADLNRN